MLVRTGKSFFWLCCLLKFCHCPPIIPEWWTIHGSLWKHIQFLLYPVAFQLCFNLLDQVLVKFYYLEIQKHRRGSTLGHKISKILLCIFVSLYRDSFWKTAVIEALSQACTAQKLPVHATELQRNIFLQQQKKFFQLPYPQNQGWW